MTVLTLVLVLMDGTYTLKTEFIGSTHRRAYKGLAPIQHKNPYGQDKLCTTLCNTSSSTVYNCLGSTNL